MLKNSSKYLKLLLGVLPAVLLLLPDPAWADDSIFTIIGNKMVSTVVAVRSIAYVIAAFGLIMFTVLAVFNKLSWKHLMYIIASLWILSVMMPFINYFSGTTLSDNTSEQVWGDNLSKSKSNSGTSGSDASASADCTTNCPTGSDGSGSGNSGSGGSGSGGSDGSGSSGGSSGSSGSGTGGVSVEALSGTSNVMGTSLADVSSAQLDLTSTNAALAEQAQKQAEAAAKCANKKGTYDASTGKCNVSFSQQIKNAIQTGQQYASGVNSAANSVNSAKNTVTSAASGMSKVVNAVSNIGTNGNGIKGLVSSIGNVGSTATSAINSTTGNFNSSLSSAQSAMNSYGQITGKDVKNSSVYDSISTVKQGVTDARNAGTSVTTTVTTGANTVNNDIRATENFANSLGL